MLIDPEVETVSLQFVQYGRAGKRGRGRGSAAVRHDGGGESMMVML